VITGAHTVLHAEDPPLARAYLREVLRLTRVNATGDDRPIFGLPPAEIAVHPTEPATSGRHELYLMCAELDDTVAELTDRGAEFTGEVSRQRWGTLATLVVPGLGPVRLYQPTHPTAQDLAPGAGITGAHTVLFAEDADRARAVLRDVLRLPAVDGGGGWPIFAAPPSELAVYPAAPDVGQHELCLLCDDLEPTIRELADRGAEFGGDVSLRGWGVVTTLVVGGLGPVTLYQPLHPVGDDRDVSDTP
jgi:hypothetical protein